MCDEIKKKSSISERKKEMEIEDRECEKYAMLTMATYMT